MPDDEKVRLNPLLRRLQPYPFERLRAVLQGITPPASLAPINFSIGEPKHPTPAFILEALASSVLSGRGLANYPTTLGPLALRQAIARWLGSRHKIPPLNADTEILPVLGSREALFSFAQTVLDASRAGATVVMPNPFYQIYEGAALLAGTTTYFVNNLAAHDFRPQWTEVPEAVWQRTQLLFVCSPDNPTGRAMTFDDWQTLFTLSDRHGFIIAADECYSEIYFDEENPPLGSLAAAHAAGRNGYPRLVSFGSLSKRSNVPGLRSGYVAGDAALLRAFLLYRTYHGSAMSPPVVAASIAAWNDEAHVRDNRAKYAAKFDSQAPRVQSVLTTARPDAGFYFWAQTPIDDVDFARRLYAEKALTVLPGSYLGRDAHGENPGQRFVRLALVGSEDECAEGIDRLIEFCRRL